MPNNQGNRIYSSKSVIDLEPLFEANINNLDILYDLHEELTYRTVKRAKRLLEKVEKRVRTLEQLNSQAVVSTKDTIDDTTESPFLGENVPRTIIPDNVLEQASEIPHSSSTEISIDDLDWKKEFESINNNHSQSLFNQKKPIENKPKDILDTWTVIETLSPKTYKRDDELLEGKGSVHLLTESLLPWNNEKIKPRPNHRLLFTVYLGEIDLQKTTDELLRIYQDESEELSRATGKAALAAVVVDSKGRPSGSEGLSISSFGWAYSKGVKGRLSELKNWGFVEKKLLEGLFKFFCAKDSEGNLLPINRQLIQKAYEWLIRNCEIPGDVISKPRLITSRMIFKFAKVPDPPLLNSFYLNDLQRARKSIELNTSGAALNAYLGITKRDSQHDIFKDNKLLKDILQPKNTPLARWPVKGRFPLVLMQQAAVNLVHRELNHAGLFSINGPPGTGKTTLLRDVIADVIVKRAIEMSKFNDPEDAFKKTGKRFTQQEESLQIYELDASLKGFEIIVASSNNKAVENISKELPNIDAIAEDVDFRYFKPLADELLGEGEESWGLVATVLGNAANKGNFVNKAWYSDDTNLKYYFAHINGSITKITDELTDEERSPKILEEGDPPQSIVEARNNWTSIKDEFLAALETSANDRKIAQRALELKSSFPDITEELTKLKGIQDSNDKAIETSKAKMTTINNKIIKEENLIDQIIQEMDSHIISKPGVLGRLFSSNRHKQWLIKYRSLKQKYDGISTKLADTKTNLEEIVKTLKNDKNKQSTVSKQLLKVNAEYEVVKKILKQSKEICGDKLVTDNYLERDHNEKQTSTPVYVDNAHTNRDELFVLSMKLHKAFIDAACRPLRQNLAMFMNLLGNKKMPKNSNHLMADIWSTGFILSPVYSTAFASIDKMLNILPEQSIGWLLIDEAGQASPQQAVGAIMRSKRVVVVGDPLQIAPVVTTPKPLLEGISEFLGVDEHKWVAPKSSVQRLADNANSYGALIDKNLSSIWVGSPLLVHRRCEDPMFSISNKMAYNGKMVKATIDMQSSVSEFLGSKSYWFDVKSSSNDKYSADEGEIVVQTVLKAARASKEEVDLFVISPFKVVAEKMRRRLLADKQQLVACGINDPAEWAKSNVGTVHTFQGKEAESVILLLGAPNDNQSGARNWASNSVNLMNVAVSRAKINFYIVGNKKLWSGLGHMKTMDIEMKKFLNRVSSH